MTSPCLLSFAFEAQKTCFIIHSAWQHPLHPLPHYQHLPTPFLAKLSTNWFFLFPLSALPPPTPNPALDSNASGLWEIFIHIDRRQSWRVFHERQNSNCFCPTDVSKYQSPVGEARAGLQIRAIKPQRPDSFSYKRMKTRKIYTRHQ